MVLENGVFYQTSYDGTEVAIIVDYPGLLPASQLSNQETLCPRGFFSFFLTHRTILCSEGEAFGASCCPRASPKRAAPALGRPSKRKAKRDTVGPSLKRYGFATMLFLAVASNCDSYVHFVSGQRFDGLCPGTRPVVLLTTKIRSQPKRRGPIWEWRRTVLLPRVRKICPSPIRKWSAP